MQSSVTIAKKKYVSPKGVPQPITIYKIVGIEGKHSLFLPEITEKINYVNQPFKLNYSLLNEKDISDDVYQGTVTHILTKGLEKGAFLQVNSEQLANIKPLNNLKLHLSDYPESEDLYAKVISIDNEHKSLKIYFTYLALETEKVMIRGRTHGEIGI